MLNPTEISFNDSVDVIYIYNTLLNSKSHGVYLLKDLPVNSPTKNIQAIFEKLSSSPNLVERLNMSYSKNLVYKDSYAAGNGNDSVDMKRVFHQKELNLFKIMILTYLMTWV